MKKIARILSYLFHPVFMPLVGFFIIFNSGIYESTLSPDIKKYAYLINSLFTLFLPLSLVSLLLYMRQIQTFELSGQKDRTMPLLLTSVSLFSLFFVLHRIFPLPLIEGFSFAVFIVVFILLLTSFWLKISMHLSALGGICGLIFVISIFYHRDLFFYLLICLLVSGLVASSRILLKAHNLKELFIGFMLGFSSTFFIVLYFIEK